MDELAAGLKKIEDPPLPLGTTSLRVAERSEAAPYYYTTNGSQVSEHCGALATH